MSENRSTTILRPGSQFGQYKIARLVNRGSTNAIYRAHHPGFKRDVALKIFEPRTPSDLKARFQQDIQAIATLKHPNIIRIYDFGNTRNLYYIVMEWITGISLRDSIATRPTGLDREETMRIFSQLASAVSSSHDQNVVHGNIKPDNVLLDGGSRPVLTDFAIPCLIQDHIPSSAAGVQSAAAYLSPQQVAGEHATTSCDIYALGIVMYEMVTGNVPFKGTTFEAIAEQHLHAAPKPPGDIRVDLDPRFNRVILRALEKPPTARFRSAREMLTDLETQTISSEFETLSLDRNAAKKARKTRSEIERFKQSRAFEISSSKASSGTRRIPTAWIIAALIIFMIVLVAAVVFML